MVMEAEIRDILDPETGSLCLETMLAQEEREEEMDITDFSRTPLGGATHYLAPDQDEGGESEVECVTIIVETVAVKSLPDHEPWYRVMLQVAPPFLVAGFGMVAAGILLGIVQHWQVFVETSEFFILVPALLGLKGNLEMTLASRLATQANLGRLDSRREKSKMVVGNLALTQAQAIIVGFLAAIFALCLSWIPRRHFDINVASFVVASSVITASLASLILSLVMILVVLLSRRCHINPDNVATPIAASLGDVTCLALLSGIAVALNKALHSGMFWLSPVLLVFFLCLTPVWWVIAHRNKFTCKVLYNGWVPIIGAMAISSLGGLILDHALGHFNGMAAFQPVINGVGGNLVAVQASRLSTSLHLIASTSYSSSSSSSNSLNAWVCCPNPLSTFFAKDTHASTARVLLVLTLPGHLVFMLAVHYLQLNPEPQDPLSPVFAALYLTAALSQVMILLYVADWLVHLLHRRGYDPDNFAIPILTALGDLLGVALLAGVFYSMYLIHPPTSLPQVLPTALTGL